MSTPATKPANTEFPQIRDFVQFAMTAPSPGREGFNSRLIFGTRAGAPRISFIPNLDPEKNPGTPRIMGLGIRPATFFQFLASFEQIIKDQPDGTQAKIENFKRDMSKDIPKFKEITPEDLESHCVLHYGKDKEGICWIALQHPLLPNVRFKFESSIYHKFIKPDGQPVTAAEGSKAAAMGHIEALKLAYAAHMAELNPPFDPANRKGGKGKVASSDGPKSFGADAGIAEDSFSFD